jgi:hypothetical protein
VRLPGLRRKPSPRHALPESAGRRRTDGATLGIVVALILTSGFVAGTTATFTAGTENSNNVFATAALNAPSAVSASLSDNTATIAWTNSAAADNTSAGTRVSWRDDGAMASTAETFSCSTTAFANISTVVTTVASPTASTTETASGHASYVDGKRYCYQLRSVFPCCASTSPWLSQSTSAVATLISGVTLIGATFVGNNNGVLNAGTGTTASGTDGTDYFVFTFNQAIQSSTWPTGYLCTDSATGRILIGVSSNTTTAACPKTGTGADTIFRGLYLVPTAGSVSATSRMALGTASSVTCTVTPGCFSLKVPIRGLTAGSAPTVSTATFSATGGQTSPSNYLKSATGVRNYCASQSTPTVITGSLQFTPNPAGGTCVLTALSMTSGGADF